MSPVHYKGGGETLKDLLSGQVKVMFSTIPPVLGFVRDGRLRGLATTPPKRDPALPDLPTIAKSGLPGYDVRLWFGLAAPKGTPRAVIDRLATAVKLALELGGHAEEARGRRLRAAARHAGAIRRILQERSREVGQGGRGRRLAQRLISCQQHQSITVILRRAPLCGPRRMNGPRWCNFLAAIAGPSPTDLVVYPRSELEARKSAAADFEARPSGRAPQGDGNESYARLPLASLVAHDLGQPDRDHRRRAAADLLQPAPQRRTDLAPGRARSRRRRRPPRPPWRSRSAGRSSRPRGRRAPSSRRDRAGRRARAGAVAAVLVDHRHERRAVVHRRPDRRVGDGVHVEAVARDRDHVLVGRGRAWRRARRPAPSRRCCRDSEVRAGLARTAGSGGSGLSVSVSSIMRQLSSMAWPIW